MDATSLRPRDRLSNLLLEQLSVLFGIHQAALDALMVPTAGRGECQGAKTVEDAKGVPVNAVTWGMRSRNPVKREQ